VRALDAVVAHALGSPPTLQEPCARRAARAILLDTLGVGISGARLAERSVLIEAAGGNVPASTGGSRLLGDGRRLTAAAAALLNAWQIHNQEFDCVHESAVVHPMAVIGAVLLAIAERCGQRRTPVSGASFIDAMMVSVDVAATVGLCAREPMRFFRPAMAGALGALAGATRLVGGNGDTLRHAYGLLLAQLSGTMQAHVEGTPGLPLQIGFNARAAVNALDLALGGVEAPRDALEGPFGYFPVFEGRFELGPFDSLGQIARMPEVSHKPFPTGRAAHGALDGLMRLDAESGIDVNALVDIVLEAPPLVRRLIDRPARVGMRPAWARLCLPWLVATWLQKRAVDVTDVDPGVLDDVTRHRLAARVRIEANGVEDPNALVPQRLVLRFGDGSLRSVELSSVLGSPACPLSPEAQLRKFETCLDAAPTNFSPARRAELVAAVETIDTLPDVTTLVDLCIGEPRSKETVR
jgi:2-methylcitrate dehydratase PrpD